MPPGIQPGSLLSSHRPLILEEELAHHSALGACYVCSYPRLLSYSAGLILALEGSQSQLHQQVGMSHQPQEKWGNCEQKGLSSLRTCLLVLQPLGIRLLLMPGIGSTGTDISHHE